MKKIILLIIIAITFAGCSAQRSIEYLSKMENKIVSVTDFEVQGITIDDKSQLGDFSPSDLLKLIPAFSHGDLPASFTLNLVVKNPNPTKYVEEELDLKIVDFPWELFVNNKKILSGNITEPIHLKGNILEEKIPIKVYLNIFEVVKKDNVNEILNTVLKFGGKNSSTSNISLYVQPKVGTIFGDITSPNPIKIVDYEFR